MAEFNELKNCIIQALNEKSPLRSRDIINFVTRRVETTDQTIYNALNYHTGKGLLKREGHFYSLASGMAHKATIRPYTNGNGQPATLEQVSKLATYQQGRKSKQVMIVSSPVYYEDVVRIELVHSGGVFIVPMFGGLTVCTGPDIPKLSPDQESYRGVRAIQLTFRNGRTEKINVNESGHITISQME